MIKNFVIFFLCIVTIGLFSCSEEKPVQNILTKKATLDTSDIRVLIAQGYLTNEDVAILGAHIIKHINFDYKKITYGELLDVLKELKKQNNTGDVSGLYLRLGSDTIFMRNPQGGKQFIGMGAMTFEEMIQKASRGLPPKYSENLNQKLSDTDKSVFEIVQELSRDETDAAILGSIVYYITEDKNFKNFRIGDVAEVGRRIRSSKEFKPFLPAL